jgi:hypothetical protein
VMLPFDLLLRSHARSLIASLLVRALHLKLVGTLRSHRKDPSQLIACALCPPRPRGLPRRGKG